MPGWRKLPGKDFRQFHVQREGLSLWLVQTGMGVLKAKDAARTFLRSSTCDLAISSGFAGALVPCAIGDVVLPRTILLRLQEGPTQTELPSFPCRVEYHDAFRRLLQEMKVPVLSGGLVTVANIVASAEDKQQLQAISHAEAVDMESGVIAEVAQEQGIPFFVIRTVSDLRDEKLPKEFALFLSPSTWLRGVWELVKSPKNWASLLRLARQSREASRRLTRVCEMFFQHVGQ